MLENRLLLNKGEDRQLYKFQGECIKPLFLKGEVTSLNGRRWFIIKKPLTQGVFIKL